MTDPKVSYFFKKFYHNIIKWWFVIYNPIAKKIWPSKAEEEAALALENKKDEDAYTDIDMADDSLDFSMSDDSLFDSPSDDSMLDDSLFDSSSDTSMLDDSLFEPSSSIPDDTFNSATNSYSGLYGKGPVDNSTQSVLEEIMGKSSSQSTVDSLLATVQGPTLEPADSIPDERDAVIQEANAIYERLLQEAADDEAIKQAEIDAIKAQMEQ